MNQPLISIKAMELFFTLVLDLKVQELKLLMLSLEIKPTRISH